MTQTQDDGEWSLCVAAKKIILSDRKKFKGLDLSDWNKMGTWTVTVHDVFTHQIWSRYLKGFGKKVCKTLNQTDGQP